ncbi:hypothetical protein DYST_01571 [Dyella terrae]|nr:hypothetical protein DYST_01571 [Dyella terrae]
MEGVKSRDLTVSARRIAAIVVAIGFHLILLIGLLRPIAPRMDTTPEMESSEAVLKVRFVSLTRLTPTPPASPTSQKTSVKEKIPPPVQRATHVAVRPPATGSTGVPSPPVADTPATPDQYTNGQTTSGDGGFRDRILNARHSQGIHGVPGSDRRVAPGIELTDPMNQGIGSVMRNAQRLFGVTNHHCIDVDVWQHLTPDELKERHLTAADVEKESQKYNCNRPLGLNF